MSVGIWTTRAVRVVSTVAIAVLLVGIGMRIAEAARFRRMSSSILNVSTGTLHRPAMTSLASYPRIEVTGNMPSASAGQIALAVTADCILCGQALQAMTALAVRNPTRFKALTLILVNIDGRAPIEEASASLARAGIPFAVAIPTSAAAFAVRTGSLYVPSLIANGAIGGCSLSGTVSTESLEHCVAAAEGKRAGLFVQHGRAGMLLPVGAEFSGPAARDPGGLRRADLPSAAAVETIPEGLRRHVFGEPQESRQVTILVFVAEWGAASTQLLRTLERASGGVSAQARVVVVRLDAQSEPNIAVDEHVTTIQGYDSVLASAFRIDKVPTTIVMRRGDPTCLRAPGLLTADELAFAAGTLASPAAGGA